MLLVMMRALFVAAAVGLAVLVVRSDAMANGPAWLAWGTLAGIPLAALLVVACDLLLPHKRLDVVSSVYFGLVLGLVLAALLGLVVSPLDIPPPADLVAKLLPALVFCYGGISLLLQTRHELRLALPYGELSGRERPSGRLYLDTSAVIDGRIAEVAETGVFEGQLVAPRCVVAELQGIADSSDKLRRTRGRRGLDILNRLRASAMVDLVIDARDLPELAGQPVDQQLVLLAKQTNGKVITNDYNLNKVARLHDVPVINLNDLASALKPAYLPGEMLDTQVIRPGEQPGQGVGYLDDGTMVVIENARDQIGQQVRVVVTSVTQTSAGRMIFGRCDKTVAG